MHFHWEYIGRLGLPLAIAALVAITMEDAFGIARRWAIPAGLWVAVQSNNLVIVPRWEARQKSLDRARKGW